jgi:hypothetical protein
MIIEYDSNNSGGDWWLTDEDWKNLEKGGWKVEWEEFLGAKAHKASLECRSLKEAIKSFEKITGQDTEEEGCECCGPPHYFSEARKLR